jgi:hypothetical protein
MLTGWVAASESGCRLQADMNKTIAVELYDHTLDNGDDFDAYDQINLAGVPQYAAEVAAGARIVREGWKKQLPPAAMAMVPTQDSTNQLPAQGSTNRVETKRLSLPAP